jgi:ATP-dependent DNA helicase RecG
MKKVQEKRAYTNDTPFDDRIHMQANIEDMRASLISEYLYTIGSDLYQESLRRPVVDFADTMRLVGGPRELRKPLNVGLLFFSEQPDTYFPYARIEIVDKPDPTGIGMTEKVVVGQGDRQLRDTISYIRNYVVKERVTKVRDRAEAIRAFNFPPIAIEEALSNAVYHKSYQIREPITVTITPEKLEITSLPGPDRTIIDEDLAL